MLILLLFAMLQTPSPAPGSALNSYTVTCTYGGQSATTTVQAINQPMARILAPSAPACAAIVKAAAADPNNHTPGALPQITVAPAN